MRSMRAVVVMLLLVLSANANAHEVRPAYLRIQQIAADKFDLLWRVPARGEMRLALYVPLPSHCENAGEVHAWQQGGVFVERWSARCTGGLAGHELSIDGLSSTLPTSWRVTNASMGRPRSHA